MAAKRRLRELPAGDAFSVKVEPADGRFRVLSDSPAFEADVERSRQGPWSVLIGGRSYETRVSVDDDGVIRVSVEGERFCFGSARQGAGAAFSGRGKQVSARASVKAPMPGKVVKLLVAVGDAVTAGQGVLLFEAMKMQNEIKSPQEGTLSELLVTEGQAVEARDLLFAVKP
jgi:biotin carboxyl carrier protein